MIVQRFSYKMKKDKEETAIALIKAEIERYEANSGAHTWRIYTSNIGAFWALEFEVEFASLAEMEAYWGQWFEDPEAAVFLKKFNKTLRRGDTSVWNLVE